MQRQMGAHGQPKNQPRPRLRGGAERRTGAWVGGVEDGVPFPAMLLEYKAALDLCDRNRLGRQHSPEIGRVQFHQVAALAAVDKNPR